MNKVEGQSAGLAAGIKVATSRGWTRSEDIEVGDKVLTFDAGMQEVLAISRAPVWGKGACPSHLWPLYVPEGSFNNAQPMLLMPEQSVMIESDIGEEIYGDAFTLIPAAALEGFRDIRRVAPEAGMQATVLQFAEDQVVFSAAGALMFCPSARQDAISDLMSTQAGAYTVLDSSEAEFLLSCISADDEQDDQGEYRARERLFA